MGSIFTATLAGNLAGSPLAGLILGTTAQKMEDGSTHFNYLPVILYSGLTQLAAATLVTLLRFRAVGWKVAKKY